MKIREIIFVIFICISCISSCSTGNQDSSTIAKDYCLNIEADIESAINERDTSQDSLLLESIKDCGDSPKFVELRLDILSNMKRYNQGLEYIASLDNNNFVNPFDSLVYSTSFKLNLTQDESAKLELTKKVVHELEYHLTEFPLDTLALINYCAFSLDIKSKDQIISELDSMARHNKFDGTYAFVVWLYLPDKQELFQQKKLEWENQKSI